MEGFCLYINKKTILLLASIMVLVLSGAGVYAATTQSSNTSVIYACLTKEDDHSLRIVDANTVCKKHETKIFWNVVGPKGDKGDPGIAGPTGPQGPAGVNGKEGAVGPQGIKGDAGAQGPQGAAGPVGPQGPAGKDGAPGPQGPAGVNGKDGVAGPVGPQGPSGILPEQIATMQTTIKNLQSAVAALQAKIGVFNPGPITIPPVPPIPPITVPPNPFP
jgi:hypothetical protein